MSLDTTSGVTFAYFTDTHVALGATISAPDGAWEIDSNETLRKVVRVLGELEETPAFAVIGGDLVSPDLVVRGRPLTDEDYEPSYGLLLDILSPLEYPVHMLLGNHDSRPAFHRAMKTGATLDATHDYSFDVDAYHFVALDSLDIGRPGGCLTEDQMEWLSEDLKKNQAAPTVLFVHHHPVPVGNDWIDGMSLRSSQYLFRIIDKHPQVRWIFCGHVHMDHHAQRGNVSIYTSPSTCFQISQIVNGKRLLPGPPAFRLVTIDEQGLATKLVYLHTSGS